MFGKNGNIDTLKASIAAKGGVARTNRFNVIFTPPKQSLLNLKPEVLVGQLASGDTPSVRSLINDPRDISLLCESVSIPGRSISTIDYMADKQSNKFPNTLIDSEIEMTWLLTNDYYMKTMFDGWLSSIIDMETYTVGYKNDFSTDVIIQQLNVDNIPVYGVKLEKAYPLGINQIELSNSTADEIAKVSVTWAYDKYVVEGPVSSTKSAIQNAASLLG